MTNAEIIAKIKAEIERRTKELDEQIVDIYDSKAVLRKDELQKLLSFLSYLESEKPMQEGLKEEINRYLREECSDDDEPGIHEIAEHFAQWGAEHFRDLTKKMGDSSEIPRDLAIAAESFAFGSLDEVVLYGCTLSGRRACFIAGAKWQYQKDRGEFAKIKAKTWNEGFDACKEQMMKEAVEIGTTEICWVPDGDRVFPTFDPPVEDLLMPGIISQRFNGGDKVRVIIIKKEDEK